MAELEPYPFDRLIRRVFRELERQDSIFDLPRKKFVLGAAERDYAVRFHGMDASSPLGPAAGPHSQMAQNLVLAWLGGSRIMELKTVQIMDELEIPRPCIDMHNVGYNVEWSQELKLVQSLDEYVKGSMLIEMLRASGKLEVAPGFDHLIFDMSVGYDLEGIQSKPVRAFIEGMMDASAVVERLRAEIPDGFSQFRDLEFNTKLSSSLTLSTFHGCPPDEIERIIDFLLTEYGLHCVIKLNPTLLGPDRVRALMHDEMGYPEVETPAEAFEKDAKWDQAVEFTKRLKTTADGLGLGLGVKFSNTLIVRNHREFFPDDKEMYLSGPPLHVLAMNLVRDWRRLFGASIPISFAAGIDRKNFPDAVALGLTPITVCSDMLKQGGYARQHGYFQELSSRMDEAGAKSVPGYIVRAYGGAKQALEKAGGAWSDEVESKLASGAEPGEIVDAELAQRWVNEAKLLNTELYVERATADARYAKESNTAIPKKMGTKLELFNCITCDKCIPVCPNDANFALKMPKVNIPIRTLAKQDGVWHVKDIDVLPLTKKHQIANFADFCNECGNCDVFCPEDGGPYIMKPRFFGTREAWTQYSTHDGFYMERSDDVERVFGRFDGHGFVLEARGDRFRFTGDGFDVHFNPADIEGTAEGEGGVEIDLTYFGIMDELRKALFAEDAAVNYANA